MQIILIIIAIIIIYAVIAGYIERRKERRNQKIRDQAAEDVLKNFDYNKERSEILKIANDFVKKEYKCSACNGILISRIGKFGQFWGCSNYPKCKFTKSRV